MKNYSEITPYIEELAKKSCEGNRISPEMYTEHHVFRGLRDMSGHGVVTGLTEIGEETAIVMTDMDEENPQARPFLDVLADSARENPRLSLYVAVQIA